MLCTNTRSLLVIGSLLLASAAARADFVGFGANLEQTENNRVTRSALGFNRRESAESVDPDTGETGKKRSWWDRFRRRR